MEARPAHTNNRDIEGSYRWSSAISEDLLLLFAQRPRQANETCSCNANDPREMHDVGYRKSKRIALAAMDWSLCVMTVQCWTTAMR